MLCVLAAAAPATGDQRAQDISHQWQADEKRGCERSAAVLLTMPAACWTAAPRAGGGHISSVPRWIAAREDATAGLHRPLGSSCARLLGLAAVVATHSRAHLLLLSLL